jgi:hypothetical protein
MNIGNSVQDADPRCAVTAQEKALPVPSVQHVQHIQEIIDKLAAVTRQLSRPGNG